LRQPGFSSNVFLLRRFRLKCGRLSLRIIKIFNNELERKMKNFLLTNVILGASVLGFAGCTTAPTNSNTTILNKNAAVVTSNVNSNANSNRAANTNSNSNSNMNSNTSSGKNKNVSDTDKVFLNDALEGGMKEVQMGGMATTKALSDEVRGFAQQMIHDHSRTNNEMRDIAKDAAITTSGGTNLKQQEEMAELGKLSGAAFDKQYVKLMVEDHEKDVAEFQKQADTATNSDIKRFAAETLPTLKQHLEMIKAIKAKLK
jgi:putative membrane protein